ncbi:MAG: tryptophan synthase subunit alpha [Myxococcota bacterium]|nr:tryptophan synthase subunit alpha [Myxococcota bacterium]
MGRIGDAFDRLRAAGERAFVPFVTAGDPDLETTEALVLAMDRAGADIIEIGVPFSDPTADGPTIQRASERALAGGVSLRRVLESVRRLRDETDAALVLMGYANPYLAMGEQGFARAAAEVGVDGVIVPDLPPEEGHALYSALEEHGVDGILLAAPTTTPERMAQLCEQTRGFLYYVSLTGVTSARAELAAGLEESVRRIRADAKVPVCVGFGISTPEQARQVGSYADGVVVGSAIVDRIEAAPDRAAIVDDVARFVAEMKDVLR